MDDLRVQGGVCEGMYHVCVSGGSIMRARGGL